MKKNAWAEKDGYFKQIKAKNLDYTQLKEYLSKDELALYLKWLALPLDFEDYLMDNGSLFSDFVLEYTNT